VARIDPQRPDQGSKEAGVEKARNNGTATIVRCFRNDPLSRHASCHAATYIFLVRDGETVRKEKIDLQGCEGRCH
jgi:hypothetical protein